MWFLRFVCSLQFSLFLQYTLSSTADSLRLTVSQDGTVLFIASEGKLPSLFFFLLSIYIPLGFGIQIIKRSKTSSLHFTSGPAKLGLLTYMKWPTLTPRSVAMGKPSDIGYGQYLDQTSQPIE